MLAIIKWLLSFFGNPLDVPTRAVQDTVAVQQVDNPNIKPAEYAEPSMECVAEMDATEITKLFKYIKKNLPPIDPSSLQNQAVMVAPGTVRVTWQAYDQAGRAYLGAISACLARFVELEPKSNIKLLGYQGGE